MYSVLYVYLGSAFLANKTNRMFVSRKEKENWNMYVMDLNKFFADVKEGKVGKPKMSLDFRRLKLNEADWPTAVVRPGEKYQSHCIYKFSVHK